MAMTDIEKMLRTYGASLKMAKGWYVKLERAMGKASGWTIGNTEGRVEGVRALYDLRYQRYEEGMRFFYGHLYNNRDVCVHFEAQAYGVLEDLDEEFRVIRLGGIEAAVAAEASQMKAFYEYVEWFQHEMQERM